MPRLVEIDPVVLWKKNFFNFVDVFSLFRYYLHLENQGCYGLDLVEIGLVSHENKIKM